VISGGPTLLLATSSFVSPRNNVPFPVISPRPSARELGARNMVPPLPTVSIGRRAVMEVPGKLTAREVQTPIRDLTPPGSPHTKAASPPRRAISIADDGSSRKSKGKGKVNFMERAEVSPTKGDKDKPVTHPLKKDKDKEKEEPRGSILNKKTFKRSRIVKQKSVLSVVGFGASAGFGSSAGSGAGGSGCALSEELQSSIESFAVPDFVQQYLRQQKNLFYKKISVERSLEFSKQLIKDSIILSCDELNKQAIEMFKGGLEYMGERKSLIVRDLNEIATAILKIAVEHPQLRDELYIQLVKQTTLNPQEKSEEKGWELFSMLLELCIIPSYNFEKFVRQHFQSTIDKSIYPRIKKIATYCNERLTQLLAKPRTPMVPNSDLLSYARDIPFIQSVFRNQLPQIMELQNRNHPDLPVPLILQTMIHMIISAGGLITTGIFRVTAKTSEISALRLRLESSHGVPIEEVGPLDPHVPACLLKLWLTELNEPVIPTEHYTVVTQHSTDWETIEKIIGEFPKSHRNCLYYIINFFCKYYL